MSNKNVLILLIFDIQWSTTVHVYHTFWTQNKCYLKINLTGPISVPLENYKKTITAKELEESLIDVGGKYSCRYWEVDIKSIITYYVVYNEELKSCLGNKMDLRQNKAGVWLRASLNKESVVAWGVRKFGHWGNWGSGLFWKTWGSYIATTFINMVMGGTWVLEWIQQMQAWVPIFM